MTHGFKFFEIMKGDRSLHIAAARTQLEALDFYAQSLSLPSFHSLKLLSDGLGGDISDIFAREFQYGSKEQEDSVKYLLDMTAKLEKSFGRF